MSPPKMSFMSFEQRQHRSDTTALAQPHKNRYILSPLWKRHDHAYFRVNQLHPPGNTTLLLSRLRGLHPSETLIFMVNHNPKILFITPLTNTLYVQLTHYPSAIFTEHSPIRHPRKMHSTNPEKSHPIISKKTPIPPK